MKSFYTNDSDNLLIKTLTKSLFPIIVTLATLFNFLYMEQKLRQDISSKIIRWLTSVISM